MKLIWVIEAADRGTEDWYSCWYEIFYSAQEGKEKLKELKSGNNGFTSDQKFRVRSYCRWESRNDP